MSREENDINLKCNDERLYRTKSRARRHQTDSMFGRLPYGHNIGGNGRSENADLFT